MCLCVLCSLGETWSAPRDLTSMLPKGVSKLVAGLGAALQLSSTNAFHPNRLVFSGVATVSPALGKTANATPNVPIVYHSDDGGNTYSFSADEKTGSIILPAGIGEESVLAEVSMTCCIWRLQLGWDTKLAFPASRL